MRVPTQPERRFVFEVITTQCRRTYQAASEEEARAWRTSISMQIEALLNGTSSVRHFDVSRIKSIKRSQFDAIDEHGLAEEYIAQKHPDGRKPSMSRHRRRISGGAHKLGKALKRLSNHPSEVSVAAATRSQDSFFTDESPHQQDSSNRLAALDFPPSTIVASADDQVHDAQIAAAVEALVTEQSGPLTKAPLSDLHPMKEMSGSDLVQALSEEDGNDRCAECESVNPRWAAWNLGIFICLDCSGQSCFFVRVNSADTSLGVHRSLGVHISKACCLSGKPTTC